MKNIYLGFLISLISLTIYAQDANFEWANSISGTNFDAGYSITTNSVGEILTTGVYNGTVDFDPGDGIFNLTSNGGHEIFIQKLTANGDFIWAKSVGGPKSDLVYTNSITTDNLGNVYITGYFQDTSDFDPGVATFNLISNGISSDIFVLKLDVDGNLSWAKSMGGIYSDEGHSISSDALGNVYVSGTYRLTVDFDPGPSEFNLTSNGGQDIFVQKLDTDGNFVWAISMGNASNWDSHPYISSNPDGDSYVKGQYSGTVDFDPGAGIFNLTSVGSLDIFIQKLDSNGNLIWAKSIGGISGEYSYSVTNDASGNVYLTGLFQGTADFDPGPNTYNLTADGWGDIYIVKLDINGNFVWANALGGPDNEESNTIYSDASGNLYLTGYYEGTVDFDPGVDTFNMTSSDFGDCFVQKLNKNGEFIWAKSIGGSGSGYGYSITSDNSGNTYVTGYFQGEVDFDPNEGVYNLTSNNSIEDAFILKLTRSLDCLELFFSEYVEGSSSNKAFEIYNSSDAVIDLSDYVIYRNNNGSNIPTDSLFPAGLLESDSVFVVGNPSANAAILAESDTTHTMTFYNGDDALWLKKISTGDTLDIIGVIGIDPGSGWPVGAGATNNTTLIRKIDINQGNTNWAIASTEWDVFPIDMVDSLGSHNMTPCIGCSSSNSSITESSCDSYTSPSGNYVWTSSNTYMDTISNLEGCDSIITIILTINNQSSSTVTESACDNYTSPSGNYIWTSSDTYMDTIPNFAGCDSIITINLTINNSSSSTITESACDSYTSPSGNYIWTSSNTYMDTIPNLAGCDSVITVDLTINNSSSSTITESACDSYTSPSGNYIWTSSNTYMDTIPNLAGCDSVITIDLTINTVDVSVTVTDPGITSNAVGALYQWLDCNNNNSIIDGETAQTFTATTNGSYAVIVTENGCTDTSECVTISTVGISENAITNQVSIYPNPNHGMVNIELGNLKEVSIKVFDVNGQLIYHKEKLNKSTHQFKLNEAPGIYFVEVSTQDQKQQYKLVKK